MSSAMDDLRKKKAQADREAEIVRKNDAARREREETVIALNEARRLISGIRHMAENGWSAARLYKFSGQAKGMIFGRNTPAASMMASIAEKVIELAAEFGYEAKIEKAYVDPNSAFGTFYIWEVVVRWA